MENDHSPYYLRRDDSWTKIDYAQPAETWMTPWKAGTETDLIEIPCSWYLDDAPPVMFVKKFPNSHGWVSPARSVKCGPTSSTGCTATATTAFTTRACIPMRQAIRKCS